MQRDDATDAPLAHDLERRRIEQRAARMRLVIRELRHRAHFHQDRHGTVPPALRHAIGGFALEVRQMERRLDELARGPAVQRRSGRFERRATVRNAP